MPIKIYNTSSGNKEEFKPIKPGHVGIYNCGPTVWDTAHIGNFRTFVMDDMVRRVFDYMGYKVDQVMNITDVDDKTIKRSHDEKEPLDKIVRHYEDLFIEDLHKLNILIPHSLLRARDHIKEMVEMIEILLKKGIAYKSKDGIYFSISMFPEYGKMANVKIDAEVKERITNDNYEKENPRDFALWKFHTEEDGEIFWDASFGKGRPGWHIECSAMSTKALGPSIDIHTGAIDLLFPHHTNEIAQSESATKKHFVNYWIHGAFLNVNDEKMAKSKGNFLKLKDLEEMGISPLAFRYWLLTSHYRSPVNFTREAVKASETAFLRLVEAFLDLSMQNSGQNDSHNHHHSHSHKETEERDYKEEFKSAICDDFNMPEALAIVWNMVKDQNLHKEEKSKMLIDFDKVLGLGLDKILAISRSEEIPLEVTALAEMREQARREKDWAKADAMREEIEKRGYRVKDTENGFELKKIL